MEAFSVIHHRKGGKVLIGHSRAKNPEPWNTTIHVFDLDLLSESEYSKFYNSLKGHKGIRKISIPEGRLSTHIHNFGKDCLEDWKGDAHE